MKSKDPSLAFFQALWPGGLPDGGHIVLVIKRGNAMVPEFHSALAAAAKSAHAQGRQHDVYYGIAAQPLLSAGRGTAATALAIPCLWIDVDYSKGFPDLSSVDRFLAALPVPPSLQVLTGGGIHVYWLLQEPIAADDRAMALESGWLQHCRKVAKSTAGASLDAVADLARVLRVPGTKNHKRAPLADVQLRNTAILGALVRYSADDFEEWKGTVAASTRPRIDVGSVKVEDFVLRKDAQPPLMKWKAVEANFPEIERIFTHKQKMPTDSSVSGYDLSLATRLDAIGWTTQEIVDTIIAHRAHWAGSISDDRTTKDPLHLNDPSYYERLLRKAKASNERERVSEDAAKFAEEVVDEINAMSSDQPSELSGQRQRWITAVSQIVGIEIADLWAADSIESAWHLTVQCNGERRDIKVGKPDRLLDWRTWKSIIMMSGAPVDAIPVKAPAPLHALVCRAGMFVNITGKGQQITERAAFLSYLLELADNADKFDDGAALSNQPFIKLDGGDRGIANWGAPTECLFIKPEGMHFDMKMGRCPQFNNPRIALVEIGFVQRQVFVNNGERGTSRSYYCYPVHRIRQWDAAMMTAAKALESGESHDENTH